MGYSEFGAYKTYKYISGEKNAIFGKILSRFIILYPIHNQDAVGRRRTVKIRSIISFNVGVIG